MSPAEFCRELEAYLCRKNDGHLNRIVGPAFGTVTGWAEQGIPLKVAFKGIDRYFDRQQHKSRRRPVQIQFCEADILDAFHDWKRAVGPGVIGGESDPVPVPTTRKPALQTHIDRVMARLTQRRVDVSGALGNAID